MRETYEKQLSDNREEFGQVYDDKMRKLQEKLDQERIASSSNTQEIREMETRVSGLTSRNLELESSNAALQKRLSELVDQMELAAKNFRSDMARKVTRCIFLLYKGLTFPATTGLMLEVSDHEIPPHPGRRFFRVVLEWVPSLGVELGQIVQRRHG